MGGLVTDFAHEAMRCWGLFWPAYSGPRLWLGQVS